MIVREEDQTAVSEVKMGVDYFIVRDYSADKEWKRTAASTIYHLGKQSCPYRFTLCVYPDENIDSLEDYEKIMLANKNYSIVTDQQEKVKWPDMLKLIDEVKVGRCRVHGCRRECRCTYASRCRFCFENCDCPDGAYDKLKSELFV
jgi:hypothetical protein